jgi:hypothetical protein
LRKIKLGFPIILRNLSFRLYVEGSLRSVVLTFVVELLGG